VTRQAAGAPGRRPRWRRLLRALPLLLLAAAGATAWLLAPTVNVPLRPLLASVLPALFPAPAVDAGLLGRRLRVAAGFAFGVYATVPGARVLRFTRAGDLLVAQPGAGTITLLERDRDGDGVADAARILLDGLDGPNGMDFHDDGLYVALQSRVIRVAFDHAGGNVTGAPVTVVDGLPPGGNHWKKTLRFGPDGGLWLSIGSSCNACIEADPRRAALMRFEPDGSGGRIVARGLRNSAGFDWRPADGALYATDNGRDLLGDDFPPCELNRIVEDGFYGWPFANGANVPDPDLGAGHADEIALALAPVHAFPAHNAPLGIVFARSARLPPAYRDAAFVALHGSWNRSRKDGYKVVSLHFGAGGIEARDFMTGFLEDEAVIGRPAELAEGPDGALYVADDHAGVVYRVFVRDPDVAVAGGAPAAATTMATTTATAAGEVKVDGSAPGAGAPAIVRLPAAPDASRQPLDASLVARGEDLFGPCRTCHEPSPATATGGFVVLANLGARHDVRTLADYLAHPQPPMPPVADAEVRQALAHYLLDRFR
jgi:glucose/arabinose dehydrogenase